MHVSEPIPHGGRDPIVRATQALVVVDQLALPPPHSTVLLPLAEDRTGRAVVVVDGTTDADAVVRCTEWFASVPECAALVVISANAVPMFDARHLDRWCEAADGAAAHGCVLLDWFVVEGPLGVSIPELFGVPPRPRWSSLAWVQIGWQVGGRCPGGP